MSEAGSKEAVGRKKLGAITLAGVVIIVLLIVIATQTLVPERSVAAYCKAYGQEKARLSAMSDNSHPYPSGVFNVSVTDASQIATSFDRLSPVAPKEVESMVKGLGKLYQDMHENPSHAVANSLNGGALDDSLRDWTKNHCTTKP